MCCISAGKECGKCQLQRDHGGRSVRAQRDQAECKQRHVSDEALAYLLLSDEALVLLLLSAVHVAPQAGEEGLHHGQVHGEAFH